MSLEAKRSIKSAQLKMRELNFSVSGTAVTPVASDFDEFQIKPILDLGAGSYTIIFKRPFARPCMLAGHSMKTANSALQVVAVAKDRITVQTTDLAGVALDADFSLCVKGSDARYNI